MGELTITEAAGLPAHLRGTFTVEANDDLSHGVSQGFPILSYKGKVWHVSEGDTRSLIADEDGEPRPSIEVVILKANPNIGKTYYPDGYEEGSNEKPTCYSNDSVAPALDSPTPQAKKCAVCPHNQFGSKITENGARGKACSDFRRLAVAPSGDLERAMLLRVPAASLKELLAYAETLKRRQVPYQALVTKVGFDHTVAYPKLSFKMVRWLEQDEANTVADMIERDIVQTITAQNLVSEPVEDEIDALGPPPAHVAKVVEPTAPKAPATRTRAKATEEEVAAVITPTAAPAEPAAPKATGFGGKAPAKAAPAAAAAPAATQAVTSEKTTVLMEGALAELDSVLAGFDDEDEAA